jgi:hypothetical protein
MALVTKKYIYETITQILEGGDPSVGKKFEPRIIQAFMQQVINRKLKTEYLSVTLPGDETIPDGLVLACYDSIPVTTYKNTLSRAQLPAIPVALRRNMGVYFVGPATGGNVPAIPILGGFTIEVVVGLTPVITGTNQSVTGLTAGSTVISSPVFQNQYVNVIRGNVPIPGIDPTDGSNFFTKTYSGTSISLNNPLVTGEYVKIQSAQC